jgi:hypothetical protein
VKRVYRVFKYDLPLSSAPGEVMMFRLPAGAKILKVAEQGSDPLVGPRLRVWALIDPEEKLQELRYAVTAGTGHEIEVTTLSSQSWDYTDTVMCLGGELVVHVWISRPTPVDAVEVSADNV